MKYGSNPYRISESQQFTKDGTLMREDDSSSEQEVSSSESVQQKNDNHLIQESDALISFETVEDSGQIGIIRQPSPPPFLADVQDLIPTSTPDTRTDCGLENSSSDALVRPEDPLQLHIVWFYVLFSTYIFCCLHMIYL